MIGADLQRWAEQGPAMDAPARRDLLARLKAWETEHDADRARIPMAFFKMIWDGVFGDEHERVQQAIREVEASLTE